MPTILLCEASSWLVLLEVGADYKALDERKDIDSTHLPPLIACLSGIEISMNGCTGRGDGSQQSG